MSTGICPISVIPDAEIGPGGHRSQAAAGIDAPPRAERGSTMRKVLLLAILGIALSGPAAAAPPSLVAGPPARQAPTHGAVPTHLGGGATSKIIDGAIIG